MIFNYLFIRWFFIIIQILDPSCKALFFIIFLFDIYWLLHVRLQIQA
jgi:hypothetical protein